MRTRWILAAMILAAPCTWSQEGAASPEWRLRAYVHRNSLSNAFGVQRAQVLAAQILSAAGVHLEWDARAPEIEIQLEGPVPADFRVGSLGYAEPFSRSRVRIHVLYGRVLAIDSRGGSSAILAHVLAHEILHVLEGNAGHSGDGLMKAHWSKDDLSEMTHRLLPVSDLDRALIRMHFSKQYEGTR
jgi:hypothetical protein